MSVDVFVFLHLDSSPTLEQWQGAITNLGIDLQLETDLDVRTHTGYWPVTLDGDDSGFEYYAGPISEVFPDATPEVAGDCDWCVDFVVHGDSFELKAALLAAAGLVDGFGGGLYDEDTRGFTDLTKILSWASKLE